VGREVVFQYPVIDSPCLLAHLTMQRHQPGKSSIFNSIDQLQSFNVRTTHKAAVWSVFFIQFRKAFLQALHQLEQPEQGVHENLGWLLIDRRVIERDRTRQ
jgi:hypothetical protein